MTQNVVTCPDCGERYLYPQDMECPECGESDPGPATL